MKLRNLFLITLITLPWASIAKEAEPMQVSEQEIAQMFGVSPEEAKQMAQMMSEFDAAIKKDPELQKMFNELEQQLEQDIEQGLKEGKSIEDILGFGAGPQEPAEKPVAAAPAPTTATPEQKVAEQPKKMLRNRAQAEQIVKDLLNTIIQIQTKAAADRKVSEALVSLQPQLELIVYYLHVLSKPVHIEQLVTDPEFTQLHDTLKQLHEKLSAEEPLFVTAEMGEKLEKRAKERSKIALQTIKRDIEFALRNQQLIQQFEKLVKKYEPQALKLRTEVEAVEARAKKEAEQRKQARPVEARIKREEEYARQVRQGAGGRFEDWYYGGRQNQPERYGGGEGYGPEEGHAAEAGSKKAGAKEAAAKAAGKGEEKEEKEKKKEEEKTRFIPSAESKKVAKKIEEIDDIFGQIDLLLDTKFAGRRLPQELRAPTDAHFNTLKTTIAEIAMALGRVLKLKFETDALLRKLDAGVRGTYEQQLRTVISQRRAKIQELHQAACAVPQARQDQFTGNCPGNCLEHLRENIEALYGFAPCAAKAKAAKAQAAAAAQPGAQPRVRQPRAEGEEGEEVEEEAPQQMPSVDELLADPNLPPQLREQLENLSDEQRAEVEEELGGAGNLQEWMNSPAAKVFLAGIGGIALKFMWDWFQDWREGRAEARAAQQPAPAQGRRPSVQAQPNPPPFNPAFAQPQPQGQQAVPPQGQARFGAQATEQELANALANRQRRQPGQMVVAPVGPNVPQAPPLQPQPVVAPVGPNVPQAPVIR